MTELTVKHVLEICQIGKGNECCAYLVAPLPNPEQGIFATGLTCAKEVPSISEQIAKRLAAGTMNAKGDNCSGPPDFEVIP